MEEDACSVSIAKTRNQAAEAMANWFARRYEDALMKAMLEQTLYSQVVIHPEPETGRPGKGWEEIGAAWSKWKQLQEEPLSSQE